MRQFYANEIEHRSCQPSLNRFKQELGQRRRWMFLIEMFMHWSYARARVTYKQLQLRQEAETDDIQLFITLDSLETFWTYQIRYRLGLWTDISTDNQELRYKHYNHNYIASQRLWYQTHIQKSSQEHTIRATMIRVFLVSVHKHPHSIKILGSTTCSPICNQRLEGESKLHKGQ